MVMREMERLSHVRALIVEDDAASREMLVEYASCLGAIALGAADGDEALRSAAQIDPTVAIIDLGLPDEDGCQVARRLRSVFHRDIRLVALTGSVDASPRAFAAGFDTFA